MVTVTGSRGALDAGHATPSGEDLKTALEGFKQVGPDGLTAGPISFSPEAHRPQANESVYGISPNGDLTFVDKYSISLDPTWLGY
jgi:branched-chain amino acid transport system substrate-binding protein